MDPTLMALIMSLMGGQQAQAARQGLTGQSTLGQIFGSGYGQGYGGGQGQGYSSLPGYGYGYGQGFGGGYDQPTDPGHTMMTVPYDPNAIRGTFDPRYVTGKTGGGNVMNYGRPTTDAYGRMNISGSGFINAPWVDMTNARQAPSDVIPAYDPNAVKAGVDTIPGYIANTTNTPIMDQRPFMGQGGMLGGSMFRGPAPAYQAGMQATDVGLWDPTAPDPRYTYQTRTGAGYTSQAPTTNSGYTGGGYNGYNGGGYTGGGGYGQGYGGGGYGQGYGGGGYGQGYGGSYGSNSYGGNQNLFQSLLSAFFGGNGSSFGIGNTTNQGNQYTGNMSSKSSPLGVDPGLWAASGGTNGLTTAQGGYSQDQNFWDNMNKIATGTQTYTPWTQPTLAAGTHAKPARSGFYGIPVPIENTIAAGWR